MWLVLPLLHFCSWLDTESKSRRLKGVKKRLGCAIQRESALCHASSWRRSTRWQQRKEALGRSWICLMPTLQALQPGAFVCCVKDIWKLISDCYRDRYLVILTSQHMADGFSTYGATLSGLSLLLLPRTWKLNANTVADVDELLSCDVRVNSVQPMKEWNQGPLDSRWSARVFSRLWTLCFDIFILPVSSKPIQSNEYVGDLICQCLGRTVTRGSKLTPMSIAWTAYGWKFGHSGCHWLVFRNPGRRGWRSCCCRGSNIVTTSSHPEW